MRQIGSLATQNEAESFVDYLLSEGISAKFEADDTMWMIWVRDENQLDTARSHLARYRQDPTSINVDEARRAARAARLDAQRQRELARKNLVRVRGAWSGPMTRRAPATLALIVVSAVCFFLLGGLDDRGNDFVRWMLFGDSPTQPLRQVFRGEVWRLITPIFLHANVLHVLFNMLWLHSLGTQIEAKRGSWYFLLLVVFTAVVSNLAQALLVGPGFGGMSGVVYGLFGYIVMRRSDGYMMGQQTIFLMMLFFVLGFFHFPAAVANFAHGGGLVAGMMAGAMRQLLTKR